MRFTNIIAVLCLLFISSQKIKAGPKTTGISFYIAPEGCDTNPGTMKKPFASIERAQQAVRQIKSRTSSDIVVYVRGGLYELKHTVEFSPDIFHENDTWLKATHGKMVRQSAPAIMARNIALPKIKYKDLAPYVMASKFPNGAIAIATEGRVTPNQSWIQPKADITLKEAELDKPIGIFGYYESLSLEFLQTLPVKIKIYGQDLLSNKAIDITGKVTINENKIIIPGTLIEDIGTMAGDTGDISVPGMVIKIISN